MKKDIQNKICSHREDLKKQGVEKIIAFSGGAYNQEQEKNAEKVISESFEVLRNFSVAILTGGTKFDIQKMAIDTAKKYGLPTLGVYPIKARKYALETLDFALEVEPRYGESRWCDETEIYSKLLDGMESVGGGMGSAEEFVHVIKLNEGRLKKGLNPAYIVPISSIGGETKLFSDSIYDLPLKTQVKTECFPDNKIYSGKTAAEFLVNKLKLMEK